MFLTLLPKHGGGRMENVATFRASCAAADKSSATAWLQSATYDRPVVVKLQSVSRLSEKEATIAALFTRDPPPNVSVPICEFKCRNDLVVWKEPIRKPRRFCNGGTMTSVFVMEEIPHNLIDFLSAEPPTHAALTSILQQIGFALLYLAVHHRMSHGDIGSGNLMLRTDVSAAIAEYDLGILGVHHVPTHGLEPVLIDFQRSVRSRGAVDVGLVADEICMAFDIIRTWMKRPHPFAMGPLIQQCGAADNLADLVSVIEDIGAVV